ncbi:MAG: heavy metal-binding domain-containing protein [Pseudomonadota bacterium]
MSIPIELIEAFLYFGVPIILLVLGYTAGSMIERRHFADIRAREAALREMPVLNFARVPAHWQVVECTLVAQSIVVSLDYFKRIIAGLRGIVGGRVSTYEPLLDRARREAVLRMTEQAQAKGFDAVINVRLETSKLASSARNGEQVAGVEILAFGTALKFAR